MLRQYELVERVKAYAACGVDCIFIIGVETAAEVQAVREACLLRFRPILMTTLAAGLGALPLAIGFGQGSELRQPLGVTIIGGLVASQLLTLLTTPVVYVLLDKLRRRHDGEAHPVARLTLRALARSLSPREQQVFLGLMDGEDRDALARRLSTSRANIDQIVHRTRSRARAMA